MSEHERDERGRFTKTVLSSEEASRRAKAKHQTPEEQKDVASKLLEQLGYKDTEEAREVDKALAKQIARGGAASVTAIREYKKTQQMTGTQREQLLPDNIANWKPPGVCPVCKNYAFFYGGKTPPLREEAKEAILSLFTEEDVEDQNTFLEEEEQRKRKVERARKS